MTESMRTLGTVRLFVPRSDESVRPFDLSVNDVDVLVELKPEGMVRNAYS